MGDIGKRIREVEVPGPAFVPESEPSEAPVWEPDPRRELEPAGVPEE